MRSIGQEFRAEDVGAMTGVDYVGQYKRVRCGWRWRSIRIGYPHAYPEYLYFQHTTSLVSSRLKPPPSVITSRQQTISRIAPAERVDASGVAVRFAITELLREIKVLPDGRVTQDVCAILSCSRGAGCGPSQVTAMQHVETWQSVYG